jgi:hypothetical protein
MAREGHLFLWRLYWKKTSVNGLFFIATFELAFLIGIIIICLKPTICHLGAFGRGVYTQPWLFNMLGK